MEYLESLGGIREIFEQKILNSRYLTEKQFKIKCFEFLPDFRDISVRDGADGLCESMNRLSLLLLLILALVSLFSSSSSPFRCYLRCLVTGGGISIVLIPASAAACLCMVLRHVIMYPYLLPTQPTHFYKSHLQQFPSRFIVLMKQHIDI